jgi:hypothetical protein
MADQRRIAGDPEIVAGHGNALSRKLVDLGR